jgi:hypothetical protein
VGVREERDAVEAESRETLAEEPLESHAHGPEFRDVVRTRAKGSPKVDPANRVRGSADAIVQLWEEDEGPGATGAGIGRGPTIRVNMNVVGGEQSQSGVVVRASQKGLSSSARAGLPEPGGGTGGSSRVGQVLKSGEVDVIIESMEKVRADPSKLPRDPDTRVERDHEVDQAFVEGRRQAEEKEGEASQLGAN